MLFLEFLGQNCHPSLAGELTLPLVEHGEFARCAIHHGDSTRKSNEKPRMKAVFAGVFPLPVYQLEIGNDRAWGKVERVENSWTTLPTSSPTNIRQHLREPGALPVIDLTDVPVVCLV
jgi:hypothetical protein